MLCADHHPGYSQPIGGGIAYEGYVSPSGVGYDIGCGNKAVCTELTRADVHALGGGAVSGTSRPPAGSAGRRCPRAGSGTASFPVRDCDFSGPGLRVLICPRARVQDQTCPHHPTAKLRKWPTEQVVRAGLVGWEAVQRRLREQRIVLVGGGADEVPEMYKRLPEVLAAHGRHDPRQALAAPARRRDGRP